MLKESLKKKNAQKNVEKVAIDINMVLKGQKFFSWNQSLYITMTRLTTKRPSKQRKVLGKKKKKLRN